MTIYRKRIVRHYSIISTIVTAHGEGRGVDIRNYRLAGCPIDVVVKARPETFHGTLGA